MYEDEAGKTFSGGRVRRTMPVIGRVHICSRRLPLKNPFTVTRATDRYPQSSLLLAASLGGFVRTRSFGVQVCFIAMSLFGNPTRHVRYVVLIQGKGFLNSATHARQYTVTRPFCCQGIFTCPDPLSIGSVSFPTIQILNR